MSRAPRSPRAGGGGRAQERGRHHVAAPEAAVLLDPRVRSASCPEPARRLTRGTMVASASATGRSCRTGAGQKRTPAPSLANTPSITSAWTWTFRFIAPPKRCTTATTPPRLSASPAAQAACRRKPRIVARRSAAREGRLLDEPGQSFSVVQTRRQRTERLEVIADHLIQHTLRERPRRVLRRQRCVRSPGATRNRGHRSAECPGSDHSSTDQAFRCR